MPFRYNTDSLNEKEADMQERIKQHFNESIHTKITAADTLVDTIASAGSNMVQCLLNNSKILSCGNGGSASDAQHFAAVMLNSLEAERPSLPAIALPTNPSTLTSVADKEAYSDVFARQVKALGHPGDVLLAISPDGNSKNILEAIEVAGSRGIPVVALSGRDGGEMTALLNHDTDVEIRVPAESIARIQETHRLIIHCLCDIIDQCLFSTGN